MQQKSIHTPTMPLNIRKAKKYVTLDLDIKIIIKTLILRK